MNCGLTLHVHMMRVKIDNKQINKFQKTIFKVEMKEQLEVTDLKGNKIGVMNVSESIS